jgi:hypothetical protein
VKDERDDEAAIGLDPEPAEATLVEAAVVDLFL